jgi:nucleoid DNA-binding protein
MRDLAAAFAAESNLSESQAADFLGKAFAVVADALVKEGRVQLSHLGILELRTRKARKGRNPRTGESLSIPAKTYVGFKAGREFQERLRQIAP